MKEKLRLALVNKYKKLGYSQKAIDAVLAHLEKSVKEESEIDEAVDGIEELLKAFQSEIDSRVQTAVADAKKPKQENKPGGEPAAEPNNEPAKPAAEEMPAWAKQLLNEVSTLKAEKAATSRKAQLEEKLKDANQLYKDTVLENFDLMNFATEEDFTNYLTKVETKVGEMSKEVENTNVKPSVTRPGISNNAKAGATKQATKEELDGVMSSIMP